MKISYDIDVFRPRFGPFVSAVLNIDKLKIGLHFLCENNDKLLLFNNDFKTFIERYGNLEADFEVEFWINNTDYKFNLWYDNTMTLEIFCRGNSTVFLEFKEIEDIKKIYECLKEVYNKLE